MNKNIRKAITSLLVALSLVAVSPIAAHAEWKSNSAGWWYQNGGSYYANGWYQIGGQWYAFNGQGYMMTGWIQSGSNWYYCSPSTGEMLHDTYVGQYYLNSSGAWTPNISNSISSHSVTGGTAGNNPEGAQQMASQNGDSQQSSSTGSGNRYKSSGAQGKVTTSSDGSLSQSLQQGGN